MIDTIHIVTESLNFHRAGILALMADTVIHKVYNIPSPSTGFKWTEYLKPSIDLLIALVGAFVLIWKYLTQKQKESEERIIESKRNAYSEFLKDFTETAINITYEKDVGGIEDDRRRINARNLLLLYGNDKVVKAYNAWIELTDKDESKQGSEEEVNLFGTILIEIRKDIHGGSKVTEQEIRNLNPFYRG